MRIVVIGGTGLIGSQLVHTLTEYGHDAVAAGLPEFLTGADVVVDVSDSPSTATANLLAAEAGAGVRHHVALSVVGTDRLAEQSAYFKAKLMQERLIQHSDVPYSIVRATQFFESVNAIAAAGTDGDTVRLSPALFQPVASVDVAEAVAIAAVGSPTNGVTEVGGPEPHSLDGLIRKALSLQGDARTVVADHSARYWGAELGERTLLPGDGAILFDTRFDDWLRERAATT